MLKSQEASQKNIQILFTNTVKRLLKSTFSSEAPPIKYLRDVCANISYYPAKSRDPASFE